MNSRPKIPGPNCMRCNDTGVVMARRKEERTNGMFLCSCDSGKTTHWARPKKSGPDDELYTLEKWENADHRVWERD